MPKLRGMTQEINARREAMRKREQVRKQREEAEGRTPVGVTRKYRGTRSPHNYVPFLGYVRSKIG